MSFDDQSTDRWSLMARMRVNEGKRLVRNGVRIGLTNRSIGTLES